MWYRPIIQDQGTVRSLASAADTLKFKARGPGILVRWGFILTAAPTAPNLLVMAMDLRILLESDVGRIDAWGGTISGLPAGAAAGDGFQHTLIEGEGTPPPLDPRRKRGQFNPGEELVMEVTTEMTVGDGIFFIEWEVLPAQGHDSVFNEF